MNGLTFYKYVPIPVCLVLDFETGKRVSFDQFKPDRFAKEFPNDSGRLGAVTLGHAGFNQVNMIEAMGLFRRHVPQLRIRIQKN